VETEVEREERMSGVQPFLRATVSSLILFFEISNLD
jgi:hypothetical protein